MALEVRRDGPLPYALWSPPRALPGPPPVIVFLHGSRERGSDGLDPARVGIGPALEAFPERWPCLVVMPQCPEGEVWAGQVLEAAVVVVAAVVAEHVPGAVPALTGISLGGGGVWQAVAATPARYRRLLPICAPALAHAVPAATAVPVWLHHGSLDRKVPVDGSRRMFAALRDAGARVRYTEHPGAGHEVWDRVYADPAVAAWLVAGD